MNDFINVLNVYPKVFVPIFFLIDKPNRVDNLIQYMKSRPNFIMVTLSQTKPHEFIGYYNVNGKVYGFSIDPNYDVLKSISLYR